MKQFYIVTVLLLFVGGAFSVHAQDVIIMRDGNMIDAKIIEITPAEIRYRHFGDLDGPLNLISAADVLSIKYENGMVESVNIAPTVAQYLAGNAQPVKTANVRNNWISGELGGIPYLYGYFGIRYERMLNSRIALGLHYYDSLHYVETKTITEALFRIYPWGKKFYVGIGFGLGFHPYDYVYYSGLGWVFTLTPEIGWKIDVGEAGGFFIETGVSPPFILNREYHYGFLSNLCYFGMGYAY